MSATLTVIFIALAALCGVVGLAMLIIGIVLLVRASRSGAARGVGVALTIIGGVVVLLSLVFAVLVVMQVLLGVHLLHF